MRLRWASTDLGATSLRIGAHASATPQPADNDADPYEDGLRHVSDEDHDREPDGARHKRLLEPLRAWLHAPLDQPLAIAGERNGALHAEAHRAALVSDEGVGL